MGLFKSIGKMFNDITGATSAAEINQKHQKEFAQNAHQWEMADMEKAGLNPILSAGGSGATAGGSGGVATAGGTGTLDTITNSATSLIKLSSELDNLVKDTDLKEATKELTTGKKDVQNSEIQKNNAETQELLSRIKLNSAKALESRMSGLFQKERARGYGANIGGAGVNW